MSATSEDYLTVRSDMPEVRDELNGKTCRRIAHDKFIITGCEDTFQEQLVLHCKILQKRLLSY
jgi:hypothetical protein